MVQFWLKLNCCQLLFMIMGTICHFSIIHLSNLYVITLYYHLSGSNFCVISNVLDSYTNLSILEIYRQLSLCFTIYKFSKWFMLHDPSSLEFKTFVRTLRMVFSIHLKWFMDTHLVQLNIYIYISISIYLYIYIYIYRVHRNLILRCYTMTYNIQPTPHSHPGSALVTVEFSITICGSTRKTKKFEILLRNAKESEYLSTTN